MGFNFVCSFFHLIGLEKLFSMVVLKSTGFFIPVITMSAQMHKSSIFLLAEPIFATLDVLNEIVVVSSFGCRILVVFTIL